MNLRFLAYNLTASTYNFWVVPLQSIEEFLLFSLKYQFSQNHSFHKYMKVILEKLADFVQKFFRVAQNRLEDCGPQVKLFWQPQAHTCLCDF